MLCSFACSQIFTVVYGLYYFEVIGTTKADCYSIEGNPSPMTLKSATTASKAKNNGAKLINVTGNFDFILLLGWWVNVCTWFIPISFLLFKSIPILRNAICGLAGFSVFVLSMIQFVCVFMYRGSEAGAICSGSNIKNDLTGYQKAIVMTSKGNFLLFLLIMQWIAVACCGINCLFIIFRVIKGSGKDTYDN